MDPSATLPGSDDPCTARPPQQTLLGAHVSVAGGVHTGFARGTQIGAGAIQIFLKNANQWRARPYDDETIRSFKALWKESGIAFVAAHNSYLINLAAPDPTILEKSIHALRDEMDRAEQLGVPYVVIHPGSHLGEGEALGIRRIAASLDTVHGQTQGYASRICLEITAGQGTNLGYRLEQLREILELVRAPERVQVCLDTCHLFAAGYDFRTPETYGETFGRVREVLGFDRVSLFHLNDSRREMGSRVDRHAHIGEGRIGLEGFRLLLADPAFRAVPKVLETPKDEAGTEDVRNLNVLRGLIAN